MVHHFIDNIRNRIADKILSLKKPTGFLKERYEKELLGSIITLKNLAIVGKDRPLSADYIYERLMENSMRLRPIYQRMLAIYRSGKEKDAFSYFAEAVGTKPGKNFGAVLSKLDRINPSELVRQMEVFQELLTQERMTQAMADSQRKALIMTVWATAGVFALLINFVVVVVFLDTLEMLRYIF